MGEVPRKYPRYALEATIRVEIDGKSVASGIARDVSRGGLCASLDAALPAGSDATVELSLRFDEDTFSEPLTLPARVVWATSFGESTQTGFQFAPLSDEQRSYLEMFLRFLEQGQDAEDADEDEDPDDPFAN